MAATNDANLVDVMAKPQIAYQIDPDPQMAKLYADPMARWRGLYHSTKTSP
jgi:hypothetical protein